MGFNWDKADNNSESLAKIFSEESNFEYPVEYVWHEMGHLIALLICKKLGFDFGNVTKINFGYKPRIVTDSNIYQIIGAEKIERRNFYNEKSMWHYEDSVIDEITKNASNHRRTLLYFVYLISGGLFNIYYIEKTVTEEYMSKCFREDENYGYKFGYLSKGGSDWSKVKNIAGTQRWSMKFLTDFRTEVLELFLEYNVFENMSEFLEEINTQFNGKSIGGHELTNLCDLTKYKICGINKLFFDKLENLVEDSVRIVDK